MADQIVNLGATRAATSRAELARNHQQQARQLAIAIAPLVQTNNCYAGIEKKFKNYVDQHRNNPEFPFQLPPDKYVNKFSVESFYLQVEKTRIVKFETMKNTCKAIDHLSDREGSPLAPQTNIREHPHTKQVVNQVMDYVRVQYKQKLDSHEQEKDPHEKNPFNIISQENISKVMFNKLRTGQAWEDVVVCWSITTTTLLRFDQAQVVTLDKLFLSQDLPPWGIETPFDGEEWNEIANNRESTGDERLLAILCPPLDQRKKNKENDSLKTEGVGAFRHKRFERCPHGILAFSLIQKFHNLRQRISFKKREHTPANKIHWRDVKLFDLSYNTAWDQYNKMMEDAGVAKWLKTTHMRKAGSNLCTAQGMAPSEVRTLTKHSTKQDNFDKSYGCEVSIPVASTIAGFRPRRDEHFVPRTTISGPSEPLSMNQCTLLLFDDYLEWVADQSSPEGDKSSAASHFLMQLIPYFTQVAIQDGIYWTHNFPNNPVVELFLSKLQRNWPDGGYCVWARRQRNACKEKIKNFREHHDLKGNVTQILQVCQQQAGMLQQQHGMLQQQAGMLQQLHNRVAALQQPPLQQEGDRIVEGNRQQEEIQEEQQVQQHVTQNGPTNADQELQRVHLNENANQQQQRIQPQQLQQQQPQHHQPLQQQPQQQINLRPMSNPRRPTVSSLNTYRTLHTLAISYESHLHYLVENTPQHCILGCSKPKMMWSRIKRLHSRIIDHAIHMHRDNASVNARAIIDHGLQNRRFPNILIQAAIDLDASEKVDKTLPAYEMWLAKESTLGGKYAPRKRQRRV